MVLRWRADAQANVLAILYRYAVQDIQVVLGDAVGHLSLWRACLFGVLQP